MFTSRNDSAGAPALSRPRILVLLPGAGEAQSLAQQLESAGLDCEGRSPPFADWASLAREADFDALLVDTALDVSTLLDAARAEPAAPAVVLLAGFGTLQDAIDAMRSGAADYVPRPAAPAQLAVSLRRAADARALRAENRRLRRTLGERFSLGQLVSRDPAMARIAQIVEAVADTRAHVLLTGESGTGKTLLARAIHQASSRRAAAFVEINCGALPPTLLESELFGHVRGAFTGAVRDKAGLFEAADGGSLFLDEISSAPLDLQVKLLRAIQEKQFERVGDPHTRSVDVRVIAATNRDLAAEVAAGRFREDLFWRLNVIALSLPPLRERPGDIALIANVFLERFAAEHARPIASFSPDALARLSSHAWPGNVRQLQNAVERAVLLARGERIEAHDLGDEFESPALAPAAPMPREAPSNRPALPVSTEPASLNLKEALAEPERRFIAHALELCGGHRQRAAALLGVNRTTLFNKMRRHGLLDFPTSAQGGA